MKEQLIIDAITASQKSIDKYEDAIPILMKMHEVKPAVEHAYNRHLREEAKEYVSELAMQHRFDECDRLLVIIEAMLSIDKQTDFDAYMQFMEWRRPPEKRFYQPRRSVFYRIAKDLQDLFDGRIDFYALSLPPRVGKSTIGCFFMSFNMGNNPDDAHVMSGFSDKLTSSFWQEVLSIISDGDTYRFAEVFPDSPLVSKDAAKEEIHLHRRRRFATLTCRSASGTLTGAVEVGYKGILYCDDMVSDREESLSADRMDKLYQAYLGQLRDRKLPRAREIHIGTRWVPNDIIGRLEDEFSGNERYRFRRIPALAEDGESNFVFDFDLGFPREYYEEQRRLLINAGDEDEWSAKYQCDPFWKEGRLFEPSELNRYSELPEGDPDIVIAVCDTKDKGADYCACPIAAVYGDKHYIVDVIFDDAVMDAIEPRLAEKLVRNKVARARFESNSAGGRIARDIEGMCRLAGSPIEISTLFNVSNKETRIIADSGWVKQKCLFPNDDIMDREMSLFFKMLTSYTSKGKNKHDDAPDSMSMLRRFSDSTLQANVTAVRRPW